jgi:hypothetical protein
MELYLGRFLEQRLYSRIHTLKYSHTDLITLDTISLQLQKIIL